jgi:DNA-directed RNA polymerase subunit RPC12/RpoP
LSQPRRAPHHPQGAAGLVISQEVLSMVWSLKKLLGKTRKTEKMSANATYTCANCRRPLTASEIGGNVEGTDLVFCKDCRPQIVVLAIVQRALQEERDLSVKDLRLISGLCQQKGIEAIIDLKLREADPRAQEVNFSYFRLNDQGVLEFGFCCLQCGRETEGMVKDKVFPAKDPMERYQEIINFYNSLREGLSLPCKHCGHQHVLVK